MYNWQLEDWPHFSYENTHIEALKGKFVEETGRNSGLIEGLSENQKNDTMLELMVTEAIKTSEIENEYMSREDVMSSIKKNLGFKTDPKQISNLKAKGISELMVAVRQDFKKPMTERLLFSWHQKLMKGQRGINAGQWRQHSDPMQVISGSLGKEKVHFEAPPSSSLPSEMAQFIQWYNESAPKKSSDLSNAPVRAALAHLYFESIHPFEDGNGRIGRAISEKILSEGIGRPVIISLSRTLEANKKAYYSALKKAQQTNEVSTWLKYFMQVIVDAQMDASDMIRFTIKKSRLFSQHKEQVNSRQLKVLKRMLDSGTDGFEGGMNATKYKSITKASKATATRDLQDLHKLGVLKIVGAGRSTSYEVVL